MKISKNAKSILDHMVNTSKENKRKWRIRQKYFAVFSVHVNEQKL
jgi:hypothetical protein